jgi:hypothetical protein
VVTTNPDGNDITGQRRGPHHARGRLIHARSSDFSRAVEGQKFP